MIQSVSLIEMHGVCVYNLNHAGTIFSKLPILGCGPFNYITLLPFLIPIFFLQHEKKILGVEPGK